MAWAVDQHIDAEGNPIAVPSPLLRLVGIIGGYLVPHVELVLSPTAAKFCHRHRHVSVLFFTYHRLECRRALLLDGLLLFLDANAL